MNLVAVNELKYPKTLRKLLSSEHEVIVTNNGKPMAIMFELKEGDNPEEALRSVREARSRQALSKIRTQAMENGTSKLSMKEIDAIIAESRSER